MMTGEQLWKPSLRHGNPVRVGAWLYAGSVPLALRIFKSDIYDGTGDDEDDPEIRDDQAVECYYAELQVASEDR